MPERFKERMHLSIIQDIYSAAKNPEEWCETLSSIRKYTSATASFFVGLTNGDGSDPTILSKCVDRRSLADPVIMEILHTVTASLGQGSAISLDAKINGSFWQKRLSELFGCEGRLLIAIVAKEGRRRFILALFFGKDEHADIDAAQELMLILAPHLQLSVTIYCQLARSQEKANRLDQIFSQSLAPRVIVNDEMMVVESNNAFQRMILKRRTPFTTPDGFLKITDPTLEREIERQISNVTRQPDSHGIGWVKDGHASPGWLLKADIIGPRQYSAPSFLQAHTRSDTRYMLSFFQLGEHAGLNASFVSSVLGLSPAEAELACELANGSAPAEIAQLRGVAKNTVHNQLTSIMSRYGFHRQGQLLALLSTISFFLG